MGHTGHRYKQKYFKYCTRRAGKPTSIHRATVILTSMLHCDAGPSYKHDEPKYEELRLQREYNGHQ